MLISNNSDSNSSNHDNSNKGDSDNSIANNRTGEIHLNINNSKTITFDKVEFSLKAIKKIKLVQKTIAHVVYVYVDLSCPISRG